MSNGLEKAGFTISALEVMPEEPAALGERRRHGPNEAPELMVTVRDPARYPTRRTSDLCPPAAHLEMPYVLEAADALE